MNADEINEIKMREFPNKLKVPSTIKQIVEKPPEPKLIIDDCKFVDDSFDESVESDEESEIESPNIKKISSRSSRINYLNISSNESIRSSVVCSRKLSKTNSTERQKRRSDEEIPLSAREKREIEKHFGSFHKPTVSVYNPPTESSEESISPTKHKQIEKVLDWSYLSNITVIQTKIISTISEIKKGLSEEFPEIDGITELERIKKRSIEFLTRFSRQYLYEIGRQIQGLRTNNIVEKIYGIFNLILQALQSYLKNIGRILGNLFYEKLKILLNFNIKLNEICLLKKLFHDDDYFIEEMFKQSYRLITFVEDLLSSKEETVKPKRKEPKKISPTERLSMYATSSNENFGHKSHDDRLSSSRSKRRSRNIPSQNFIQKNIRTSSINFRKTSAHRIVSSKSVANCSPPIQSSRLDQERIVTMMEFVKNAEDKGSVSLAHISTILDEKLFLTIQSSNFKSYLSVGKLPISQN